MEFTQKDLALIAKARKKAKGAMLVRIMLLIAMLFAVGGMLMGVFDSDKLAYGLLAAVLVGIAYPQFSVGPKYEDLVSLLETKSARHD